MSGDCRREQFVMTPPPELPLIFLYSQQVQIKRGTLKMQDWKKQDWN